MRFRLHAIRILVVLFALTIACCAQSSSGEFTVVTLPDTQNYSQYYPQILTSQTQWIAANAKTLNIQFVLGLGDIVNNGSDTTQYANADASYRVLDNAKVPYLAALGNHDYKDATPMTRDATVFNSYFGPSRYQGKSYYGGNFPAGSNENFYGVFNVDGTSYLVLCLEFIPRDQTLEWASAVISENQDKKIIIVTHAFLTPSGLRQGHCDGNSAEFFGLAGDNDADALWNKLISRYPNVTMVLNGHDTGYASRQDLGVNGNLVNQIVSDYQDWPDGGGGYLRVMTFKPALNRVDITSYSPYYNHYLTDASNTFSLNLSGVPTTAQNGSVAGIVRNKSTCAPIAGASVTAKGGHGTSNSNGYYQTTSAPSPTQSITATGTNLAANIETVKVDAGYPAQLNFFMAASGAATGSISITTPSEGSNVVSPVQIKAVGVSSAGPVTTMQVYDSGTPIYTAAGASLGASLNLSLGGHELIIQGSDTHGNWFKTPVNIVVQQSGSVTMTSPLNAAIVSSPVTVTGEAVSAKGITAMQLYEDNKLVFASATGQVNATLAMTPGSHFLVLQAFDAAGNVFKTPAQITVASSSPEVVVASPIQGATVSSPVRVSANTVSSTTITAMQIYEDNKLTYQGAGSALNTTLTMSAGAHAIVVKAWDAAGKSYLSLCNITVSN